MAPKKGKAKAGPPATKAEPAPKAAAEVAKVSSAPAGSLKAGFDAHANKAGYLNITDKKAIANIAGFLELDADIVGKEMAAIDFDCNDFVSFAEFALWADKHTVGIPLGLDVPDKRQWQKGCPSYWTTIPEAEELEEMEPASTAMGSTSAVTAVSFVPVPEDPDPSALEDLIGAAKNFDWDKCWAVLDDRPGYVDMRPPYRVFAAIHQAAFEGQLAIVTKYVEEYRGNPKLLTKDGKTPEQVARGEGHTEVADYLAAACAKAYAPVAGGAKRLKLASRGRAGAEEDPAMMDKAHGIIEAAKWQKWDEMFALIKAGPECMNMRPEARKYGAIHQVAYSGDAAILKKMVECKADPCLLTRDYETALEVAKLESNTAAVEYLSKLEGADSSGENIQAAHALLDAAKDGKWEKVFELLDKAPDLVNVRPDVRVYGVIHQAAFHGDIEILRRLIEDFKANVKLLSQDGQNPLQVAQKGKQEAAANYLEACTPTINLDDDFVTYPEQEFVKVTDAAVLAKFRQLLEKTHKKNCNWTRDRDGASGAHVDHTPVPTGYELVGVVRNENPALWRIYQVYREVTKLDCAKPSTEAEWKEWKPITMEAFDWSEFGGYCKEANEWPLLHASMPEALNAIARTGFTMKKLGSGGTTGSGGLYGDGTYFADSITKGDEYARRKVEKGEFKGCRTAAVCRVVGGRHYYTDKDVADKEKPKFAQRVLEGHYNSTVGDRLKLKNSFREYVVYDASATYLEYIIYYKRKGVPAKHI